MRASLLTFLVVLAACRATNPAPPAADPAPEELPVQGSAPSDAQEPELRVVETPAAPQAPDDLIPPVVQRLRAHTAALAARAEQEVEEIRVQHLLVSFRSAPGTGATRNRREAETLAAQLFERVQAGEDFGALVEEYTDDAAPGIYAMTTGRPNRRLEIWPRENMVPAFGDVGYRLAVGELGVAPYDEEKSPYGWHLIKRLD